MKIIIYKEGGIVQEVAMVLTDAENRDLRSVFKGVIKWEAREYHTDDVSSAERSDVKTDDAGEEYVIAAHGEVVIG